MESLSKRALVAELRRRRSGGASADVQAVLRGLSPVQMSFISDKSRFKVAVAGRRAGKSVALAAHMITVCLSRPQAKALYLGLTRDSAKNTIWQILKNRLDEAGVEYKAHETTLTIKLANDSQIVLMGCDTPKARDRLRGQAFDFVGIDECGFTAEADAIALVLLPALSDHGGTLCLTSSPGEQLVGLLYEADQGALKGGWSRYFWTMRENPHYQQPATNPAFQFKWEEEEALVLKMKFGNNPNHPAFRREYRGEWVADATTLVYPFTAAKNQLPAQPAELPKAMHVIGLDLGFSDPNAIVVGQYSLYSREFRFVDFFKKGDLDVDQLFQFLQIYLKKYDPVAIVTDVNGYGKGVSVELTRRYGVPITPAEKQNKRVYQEIFRSDLYSGYIKVIPNSPLLDEWAKLVKDPLTGEEKDGENHLSDAALYAYRYAYSRYLQNFEPPKTEEERYVEYVENLNRVKQVSDWEDNT